ncbi:MAG: ribulose 1,5-bisphosphate carboxylase, partial [Planctomycetes bacterium]|nr:ribulose 1,5-bisphosphate carboxylase [Planctomycetota bacterium]
MSVPDIRARYFIETAFPLEEAVAVMAGEQSSGTFVKLASESAELTERHAAKVISIEEIESVDEPSLPGARVPKGLTDPIYKRAIVELSFPFCNIGASLPNLLATVAGNLFELAQFSGLRLIDIDIPDVFAEKYPGPAFGIAGTRELCGVYDRPIIGTIVKPSVGLTVAQTADLVETLATAGLDFIKDDELMADPPYAPFADRVHGVMDKIHAHHQRSNKKVMYAFNITGEIEEMIERHDLVEQAGGSCVMVSLHSIGLSGLNYLRRHCRLPIHAHRNGWGIFSRCPQLGISYVAWQKFWRLAGADHMHVNGLRNKFCESDASVIASAKTCLCPMSDGKTVMPVFSSGQSAGQAVDTYAALGSVDLMYVAGGGIMAHPDGPAAGVVSLQQAWEAAV